MSFPINILRETRKNILQTCESLSLEQINKIPEGMNNNLCWNAGHVIATHQLLCYGLGHQSMHLPSDFIDRYRKGSKPSGPISGAEWTFIKERLLSTVDQFETDLRRLDFNNFREYTTSYGITLRNVGQALSFNNTHEGMHLGNMLVMKKLL